MTRDEFVTDIGPGRFRNEFNVEPVFGGQILGFHDVKQRGVRKRHISDPQPFVIPITPRR